MASHTRIVVVLLAALTASIGFGVGQSVDGPASAAGVQASSDRQIVRELKKIRSEVKLLRADTASIDSQLSQTTTGFSTKTVRGFLGEAVKWLKDICENTKPGITSCF